MGVYLPSAELRALENMYVSGRCLITFRYNFDIHWSEWKLCRLVSLCCRTAVVALCCRAVLSHCVVALSRRILSETNLRIIVVKFAMPHLQAMSSTQPDINLLFKLTTTAHSALGDHKWPVVKTWANWCQYIGGQLRTRVFNLKMQWLINCYQI